MANDYYLYGRKRPEYMANTDLNRIKAVLAEQKKTGLWLSNELGKDPATVSKWCTNTAQPSIETLRKIADILEVDVRSLLISSKPAIGY